MCGELRRGAVTNGYGRRIFGNLPQIFRRGGGRGVQYGACTLLAAPASFGAFLRLLIVSISRYSALAPACQP